MDMTDLNARVPLAGEDGQTSRLHRQAADVRRRSRLIRRLRGWFPIAIVLLIVLNFGWILVSSVISSLNVYGGKSNEIRMTNPRYHGQTGKSEPFTISGVEAVTRTGATVITLKAPVLEFRGETDGATRVTAQDGVFDQEKHSLTLKGKVELVAGASDFTFRTEEAVVDLNNSTVSGDKHVEGSGSVGHIVGESFVISDNGKSIQFRGKGAVQVTAQMK